MPVPIPQDRAALKEKIKVEALRLGFTLSGVTAPEAPPHFAVFESWLAAGRHGEMGYLASERARQRRADPLAILPECRSILVLGIKYDPPAGASEDLNGRLASYAWGADYHAVLPERLAALVDRIEAFVGHPIPNRWYTDTGPLLERDLAQRAGLGWIGKNTCLINPQRGSYFLLAEVLLGVELEPDLPFLADRCGSCTRCLEACPTSCILPDRTLDAARCISYLTIELKGPIPAELRAKTGDWVFGCDICQQVCPWNQRFGNQKGDPAFSARPGLPDPDLQAELQLSPQDFNHKFKGSPVRRAKRRGYLRNIAVALGNRAAGSTAAGSAEAGEVAALSQALLGDPEALVRGHAAWALGRIRGEAARRAVEAAAQAETDPAVIEEIKTAQASLAE